MMPRIERVLLAMRESYAIVLATSTHGLPLTPQRRDDNSYKPKRRYGPQIT